MTARPAALSLTGHVAVCDGAVGVLARSGVHRLDGSE